MPSLNNVLQTKTTDRELVRKLWDCHKRYNELLAETIIIIFKLHRGEYDISKSGSKRTIRFVRSYIRDIILKRLPDPTTSKKVGVSKVNEEDAINLLRNPLACKNIRSHNYTEFSAVKEDIKPLLIPGATSDLRSRLLQDAFANLRSYYSIKKSQNAVRQEILKVQHNVTISKPLLLRTRAWERINGNIRGRQRFKWQKYYDFLIQIFPQAVRPEAPQVNKLLALNPSIKEFDSEYQKYKQSLKVPRSASYTLPHHLLHPIWVNYSRSTPKLNRGITTVRGTHSIMLKLVASASNEWCEVDFDAGTRLDGLRWIDKTTVKTNTKTGLPVTKVLQSQHVDLNGLTYRLQGAKVRFKIPTGATPDYVPTEAYIDHIVELEVPKSPRIDTRKPIPTSSFMVAVDLGWTNPAYCVRAHLNDQNKLHVIDEHNIKIDNKITQIAKLARDIAKKNRETSRIVQYKYQNPKARTPHACQTLWKRRNDHLKDYVNQLAHAIVSLARATPRNVNPAGILEDLQTLTTTSDREPFYNKRLSAMVCGQIKTKIQQQAQKYGIAVLMYNPSGSSQICNHCQHLGIRYNIVNGTPQRQFCGRLFACGTCGRTNIDSDKNGALNLIKMATHTRAVWLQHWPEADTRKKAKDLVWTKVRPQLTRIVVAKRRATMR